MQHQVAKLQSVPLVIVHIAPDLQEGVATLLLTRCLEELPTQDFKHHVIYLRDGEMRRRLERAGTAVNKISSFGSFYDPVLFVRLYLAIKALRPDCIHALSWSAGFAGRIIASILHIPIIVSIHDTVENHAFFARSIEAVLPVKPDKFVTSTERVKQSLLRNWLIPMENILVLPNLIRAEGVVRYGLQGLKEQLGTARFDKTKDDFIIGGVGRFVVGGNFESLIESFVSLIPFRPDARLMLAGSGPLEGELRAKVARLPKGKVTFAICDEPYVYYSFFDCFVQPSWSAGSSMALMEAVSIGLPAIVASPDKVHSIIIDGQNGIIVAPGNVEEMTRALYRVIGDGALRGRMADEDRKTVTTTFSMKETALLYGNLFTECAQKKKAPVISKTVESPKANERIDDSEKRQV